MFCVTGSRDEQHIGMARGSHEAQPKPLKIVEDVAEGMDLQLATVARAGVHLADRQLALRVLSSHLSHATDASVKESVPIKATVDSIMIQAMTMLPATAGSPC
jgi:hypothetical protein